MRSVAGRPACFAAYARVALKHALRRPEALSTSPEGGFRVDIEIPFRET